MNYYLYSPDTTFSSYIYTLTKVSEENNLTCRKMMFDIFTHNKAALSFDKFDVS